MFNFNPETHVYTVDGGEIPSVTTLLNGCGIIETAFYTDKGASNGSRRHLLTELYDRGDLDWDTAADEDLPYLEAWISAKNHLAFEVTDIEATMYHKTYMYGGTADRLGFMLGEKWLIDLKTGAKAQWNDLQLILYGMMASSFLDIPLPKLGICSLKANGKFEFNEVTYKDKNVAIAAVMIEKYKGK